MCYIENVKETLGDLLVSVGEEACAFSWSPCEGCGSRLGGSRNEATAYDRDTNKEVLELRICVDCVMFHANGDLPEGEE